ncbi:MAG: hypothetical protein HY646_00320 [Acidobacteria bacterium]|nr:hypothetical protein [Acidobacteriota bacterium]
MVRDIVFDEHKILPCSALLQGEYGIEGVYVGVPVVLGSEGLYRVVELKLLPEELQALHRSAEAVRNLRNKVEH